MQKTFLGRTFVASSALAVLALALFSVRLMENRGQAQAAKPQATAPDFSGIWLGKGIQSLSPSDPMGKKPTGSEPDISYTPWGLQRLKAAKPATGVDQTFLDTNDLAL
jgi:hypothetical protein